MVAVAETIIENGDRVRSSRGAFETAIRTRFAKVEAKTKRLATTPRAVAEPSGVINLVEALKRSLAQKVEPEPKKAAVSGPTRAKTVPDRPLLLPYPAVTARQTQRRQRPRW
jgi:non-homologous end joining protein Ku